MRTTELNESTRGPAELLLQTILGSGAHLWHNRPGIAAGDVWLPRTPKNRPRGAAVAPGIFVPAAVALYGRLLEIYQLNAELFARFASYALKETDWRDLKIAAAALLLVQPRAGAPVRGDDGKVEFLDDDYRAVGEAMILHYQKGSPRMLSPKGVLRIAELLEVPEIAALNKKAGFGDPAAKKAPLGRWPAAARAWLRVREQNPPLLEGLVSAGLKETIKKIARKSGYRPESSRFFAVLGWKQKQSAAGHRAIGLDGLVLEKAERFDGLGEAEICERIARERLGYKETVGRLPKEVGLTPAIMAALLPSLSDKDLRILTPTLEGLGLLADGEVRGRWERAIATATDQRALNVMKNVKSRELKEKLAEAADQAVKKAVAETIADDDLEVVFLIDKSGSMQQAIAESKEAVSRLLGGFPPERLHVATFDTVGTVVKLKAPSRAAVQHALQGVSAAGGTVHGAGLVALHRSGFRPKPGGKLIVIVAGDEAGEAGPALAATFRQLGYAPAALALIACGEASGRGRTLREASAALGVPFSELDVRSLDDPYQVPRALKALLDAPVLAGGAMLAPSRWVETVMATPLVEKPV